VPRARHHPADTLTGTSARKARCALMVTNFSPADEVILSVSAEAHFDRPLQVTLRKAQFALVVGIGRAATKSQVFEALGSGTRLRVRRQPR